MPAKIHLYFETFKTSEYGLPIVRLKAYLRFKTINGWTEPFEGIIDTGAYVSILPLSIWKRIIFKSIKRIKIQGLSSKAESSIPAIKAQVTCQILDEENNKSEPIRAITYLALTDDVPLIIGFCNILAEAETFFAYRKQKGYLEI